MPLYSFRCKSCLTFQDHQLKVEERDGTKVPCDKCGELELEKLMTHFSRYTIKGDNSCSQKRKKQ